MVKHWVKWFQKGKDKFDSYGVQPPSELTAYMKSPIFHNSERVPQNGEVFLRSCMSLHIEAAFWENNLQAVINYLI